jgi:hypothetical protein
MSWSRNPFVSAPDPDVNPMKALCLTAAIASIIIGAVGWWDARCRATIEVRWDGEPSAKWQLPCGEVEVFAEPICGGDDGVAIVSVVVNDVAVNIYGHFNYDLFSHDSPAEARVNSERIEIRTDEDRLEVDASSCSVRIETTRVADGRSPCVW